MAAVQMIWLRLQWRYFRGESMADARIDWTGGNFVPMMCSILEGKEYCGWEGEILVNEELHGRQCWTDSP